ncbi:MAG: Hsp70 family protein, partial [Pseudomonadota bacterium]
MPSLISFPIPGQSLIGKAARDNWQSCIHRTIPSLKRLLGRTPDNREVDQLTSGLAFHTFAGTDRFLRFQIDNDFHSATDLCALMLKKMREEASSYLGAEIVKAVFAAPVGYGTMQRRAFERAAHQAGFEICNIISEPTAVLLAHGFKGRKNGQIAIFDFGGGTLDFSVVEITPTEFKVIGAGGDPWLGGEEFDHLLAGHFADGFWRKAGVDLRTRAVEWRALLLAGEAAKCILSTRQSATVQLDNLMITSQGAQGFKTDITRKEFDKLAEDLVDRACLVVKSVLRQTGIAPKSIDQVVLTGGTCLIPLVQKKISALFGKKPILQDPHLTVARGTAIRAAEIYGDPVAIGQRVLHDVVGRTFGAGIQGGKVSTIFERTTSFPAQITRRFNTLFDNQTKMILQIYENSASRVDLNLPICTINVSGIPPRPAGERSIEVTFSLTEDGLLNVSVEGAGKQIIETIQTKPD